MYSFAPLGTACLKTAESDCRRVVAKRESGEGLSRAIVRAGGAMGSPPNEVIHDCVARYRRLARQSWKNPPLGRLPEDARQSEERGLSRRLAPLAASLDSEGRAGPPGNSVRFTRRCVLQPLRSDAGGRWRKRILLAQFPPAIKSAFTSLHPPWSCRGSSCLGQSSAGPPGWLSPVGALLSTALICERDAASR